MAGGVKTSFTGTGQSDEFVVTNESTLAYFADFTTGSGSGTVQLQMRIAGDWLPADAAVTATMTNIEVADSPSSDPRVYRWNCSAHSGGTIYCYMK